MYNFVKHDPGLIKAINPLYIIDYFIRNKKNAWISLGGVILCLTGVYHNLISLFKHFEWQKWDIVTNLGYCISTVSSFSFRNLVRVDSFDLEADRFTSNQVPRSSQVFYFSLSNFIILTIHYKKKDLIQRKKLLQ